MDAPRPLSNFRWWCRLCPPPEFRLPPALHSFLCISLRAFSLHLVHTSGATPVTWMIMCIFNLGGNRYSMQAARRKEKKIKMGQQKKHFLCLGSLLVAWVHYQTERWSCLAPCQDPWFEGGGRYLPTLRLIPQLRGSKARSKVPAVAR